MAHYRIAEIGGDGIGPDVVAEAVRVLEAVETDGLKFSFEKGEVGAALYRRTGEDLPRETVELCRSVDAILFGAAGLPDIRHADGTELVPQITLRMMLDLYAGMRPIRLYPGVPTPLNVPTGRNIDYVIFRENTEGLFASLGGGSKVGEDLAVDTLVITRKGTERIVRRAFELCRARGKGAPADGIPRVTCVDKANVFRSYAFFRRWCSRTCSATSCRIWARPPSAASAWRHRETSATSTRCSSPLTALRRISPARASPIRSRPSSRRP